MGGSELVRMLGHWPPVIHNSKVPIRMANVEDPEKETSWLPLTHGGQVGQTQKECVMWTFHPENWLQQKELLKYVLFDEMLNLR